MLFGFAWPQTMHYQWRIYHCKWRTANHFLLMCEVSYSNHCLKPHSPTVLQCSCLVIFVLFTKAPPTEEFCWSLIESMLVSGSGPGATYWLIPQNPNSGNLDSKAMEKIELIIFPDVSSVSTCWYFNYFFTIYWHNFYWLSICTKLVGRH